MSKDKPEIANLKLNQKQAAELIGVNARDLRREDQEAPRNDDGSYNAIDVVKWHVEQIKDGDLDREIDLEKLRKLRRENDVAEGRLIDIAVLRPWTNMLESALREFGDKLVRKKKLTGVQAHGMLNNTLRTVVNAIESINNPN